MSICNPVKPLIHHTMITNGDLAGTSCSRLINSENLDRGIGLSWRNATLDDLLDWSIFYNVPDNQYRSRLCFDAALLKEDAIKNGINLEDKL